VRRRVVDALGALIVAAAVVAPSAPAAAAAAAPAEQLDTATPIKHFLVLMQANHSFDNYFGTYPGADGIPDGTCMPFDPTDAAAGCVEPFHFEGQRITAMGQSREVHDEQYNGGGMDGFVAAFRHWPDVGSQPMGYYDDRDIPYYWNVADNYVLFDRLFASASGSSFWNHMFWVTGTPANPAADELDPAGFDAVPTIFDRLQEAGVSWKFYVQNYRPEITFRTPGEGHAAAQLIRVPLLNYHRFLDDPALNSRIVDISEYYQDLRNDSLPAVSFMVPSGSSEHPPGNIHAGERFVSSLVDALMSSSSWDRSAFMWTYDDSGGWYDHVTPPTVGADTLGFRVPALLVSGYAQRGQVNHTQLDSTSALKFVEDNWSIAPLTARDANANSLTSAFSFNQLPRQPEVLPLNGSATPAPPLVAVDSIYRYYGAAAAFVLLLCLVAGVRSAVVARRRRRSPAATPEPETATEIETETATEMEATVR
jgi:phospholipase C